jgi:membrane-associated phospholipid phosphatase
MGLRKQCLLRVEQLEDRCLLSGNVVLEWNQLALDAIRQTNTIPPLASRALAITQAAVYDAVTAIDRSYEPYFAHVHASRGASLEAAAAEAAHDTLAALFPSQAATFDAALAADLVGIPPGRARQGISVGQAVAQQILDWRRTDGFDRVVLYTPGTDPGDWQPTPPAFLPALAPQWPDVTPFAMTDGSQFRPPPPPALGSAEYAAAFNEVKVVGAADAETSDRDGNGQPDRTADQTQIALFWRDPTSAAYAFGHWNEIAQQVSTERGLDLVADARLFALLNFATADAIISCWDTKYTYSFWRPVTAIQFSRDSALNPATASDPTWTPLITTPNFPSYTSAHSTVSGAAAAVLTDLFGPDYHFTTGSRGLPGVTRSFASFDAAAAEAGQSRIYGGIHYQFDNQGGLASGHALGQFVMAHFLLPRDDGDDQLRAAAPTPAPVNESLRADVVQPLLAEALARWQAAGVDTSALHGIDVRIADLGGLTLGKAAGGVIWLDNNAAGWGWFVDATPGEDSEFATLGRQGEAGRMDLLTVLEHEIGHLLGRGHEADGVMQETLDAGIRRTIGPATATDADWLGAEQTLFAWNAETPWVDHGFVSRNGTRR